MKAQKKREKEFLEEQDKKDEWERVLTGKKREQEISIAELKGIGPLGDFWQSYLGKPFIHWFLDDTTPSRTIQGRPRILSSLHPPKNQNGAHEIQKLRKYF